jgi:hypothetical protein
LLGESALPAISAIAASITAIAATSAATTVATTSAATAASSAAVSAATTAASTAATTCTFCLRSCFIHHEISPAEILTIQRVHRAIRIVIAIHFHERESTRLPRKTVAN